MRARMPQGPNPTLVQNDEHILLRGHRSGHWVEAVCEQEMGSDTVAGFSFHGGSVVISDGRVL